jgi:hypothetical protein
VAVRKEGASPSEAEIRAALSRVVTSPNFRASPQLASFLRFVVNETLTGHADCIKGYSIAVGALGRNDTFDPQTNPIVRVEAGRLRLALDRYYAGPGRHDQLVIELPRGSYIPTFGRRRMAHGLSALAAYGRQLIPQAVRRRLRLVAFVACIASGVSGTFDLALMLAERAIAPGDMPGSTVTGTNWAVTVTLSAVIIVSVVIAWWISPRLSERTAASATDTID